MKYKNTDAILDVFLSHNLKFPRFLGTGKYVYRLAGRLDEIPPRPYVCSSWLFPVASPGQHQYCTVAAVYTYQNTTSLAQGATRKTSLKEQNTWLTSMSF